MLNHPGVATLFFTAANDSREPLFDTLSYRSRIAVSLTAPVGAATEDESFCVSAVNATNLETFADLVPASVHQFLLEMLELVLGRPHDVARASSLQPREVE